MNKILALNNRSETPNDGWRFKDPDTGRLVRAPDWGSLIAEVSKHRTANRLDVWPDLEARVEQWMCESVPAYCSSFQPPRPPGPLDNYAMVEQATKTMLEWFSKGKRRISVQETEQRASICNTGGPDGRPCPKNQPIRCDHCVMTTLSKLVTLVMAKLQFRGREELKGCEVCGCALVAKVQVPLDILQKHTPEQQFDADTGFTPYCWMRGGKDGK